MLAFLSHCITSFTYVAPNNSATTFRRQHFSKHVPSRTVSLLSLSAIILTACGGSVTVHEDCGYNGASTNLIEGSYTLEDLIERGINNDSISAIKVAPGYQATLYQNDGFSGNKIVIKSNTDCLNSVAFDNTTSSLEVAKVANGTEPEDATVVAVKEALSDLRNHISGQQQLNAASLASTKALLEKNASAFGANRSIITAAFDTVSVYENKIGPMWMSTATKGGFNRNNWQADIHANIYVVMQNIVDHVYTTKNIAQYEDLLKGLRFKTADYFPGKVEASVNPLSTHKVKIEASYVKTFGHLVMHADLPAKKPTGTYLAPGTIATVTVPQSLVGKGYAVRVGAHSWDFSNRKPVKRLERSTVAYNIDRTQIKVASPLGGGIYIEVPYLADAGIVEVTVKGAVRSPYFSAKSFHQTNLSDWRNVERKFKAPWADFQSEKFMMQVPTSWISNYDDPSQALRDWDTAVDVVSDLMGYPHDRSRETLYLLVDVIIRASAFSPGYPQINATYNPLGNYNGNENHYFLKGPQYSPAWELHEMGHGQLFQKFPAETEAAVNLLYVAAMNQKFGMSLDQAFYQSRRYQNSFMTLDNTAITWMACENFKLEKPMERAEMQYQLKGHAKYVEIARLFGWKALNDYWYSINVDFEKGIKINSDINSLILRMSESAGYDVSPLIHFWGMHPNNVSALKSAIAAAKIPRSSAIYDKLMQYKASIPNNNQAFRNFALAWWEKQPSSDGYMTERSHANLWDNWNENYASQIRNNLQKIIDLYFPNGRP